MPRLSTTGDARPFPRRVWRRVALAGLVTSLAFLTGPLGSVATATESPAAPNPMAALPFYVDPHTRVAEAIKSDPTNAVAFATIASTPEARWVTSSTATAYVAAEVDRLVGGAAAEGRLPTMALYAIPNRDCGGQSAGGLADVTAYEAWIDQVVAGIAGRPVAVVVEPDALASAGCLTASGKADRYTMLRYAVGRLHSSEKTIIYIDAGHSSWLSPAQAARRLRKVGVDQARGFSLNVSNFYTTATQVAYGEAVSKALGDGSHYVIDTSRNGQGPAPTGYLDWCNPEGRGLGTRPTTKTDGPHADAYLWIKHPGESDGQCHEGDPPSGSWFGSYAVGLVQRQIG